MRFIVFVASFLAMFVIRKAALDEEGNSVRSLQHILRKSSNITYFEPAGYEKESIIEQHEAACTKPRENAVVIELFAFHRYFTLIMHQDVNLFDKDIAVTILPSSQYGPIPIPNISISLNEYYSGKVLGDASSYVTLRIHGGIIDGCYYTQSMMYHVEPSSRYFIQPLPFHSLIYRSKDVDFNLSTVKTIGHHVNVRSFTKPIGRQLRDIKTLNKTIANTCPVHIAADHHLFKKFGKGSLDDTVAEMVFHIAEADKIFRSTDFDGDNGPGDNIGFTIAAITVYQDDSAEDFFNAPSTDNTLKFLTAWSQLNHDAFCLSVLFTFQDFDGVLGLAWVGGQNSGGICSKRVMPLNSSYEINFNTAVVTLSNQGIRVPRKASIVTVTHELGHSFGAKHDSEECSPGGDAGNYIMYEKATKGNQPNNYFFSKCSKAEMWPIIYHKGPQCFIAHYRGIYCGNKIVEKGEECDCGYPNECTRVDSCCNPGNMTSGVASCKVKEGYQCSPKKGPCCTEDCQFITSLNTVCQQETECTYQSVCNNMTCPPATPKPSNTTCNHGSNTCYHGDCTGPVCTAYDILQCECTGYDSLCHVCCWHEEKGCVSASALTGQVIYQSVGSLCNNLTGYCDEYGQCIIVNTDNQYTMLVEAFKRLTSKAMLIRFTTWANTNWCLVLILWCSILAVIIMLKCHPTRMFRQFTRKHLLVRPEPNIPFNNVAEQTDN